MTGKIVQFEDLAKARTLRMEFEMEVQPYEIGLTAADLGINPTDTVVIKFRPLSTSELGQILMQVKDIDAPLYAPARDELIVQMCLTAPKLPPGAAGNSILQVWMPGTVAITANEIQKKSGYDTHIVRDAVAELGN